MIDYLALWDDASWHPFVPKGLPGLAGGVVWAVNPWNGDLVAGGDFSSAGGQTVNRIAIWVGCVEDVPGDINGDGVVNVTDLLAVISAWGPCQPAPDPCPADIAPSPDGDGQVNVSDLLMVIANWG